MRQYGTHLEKARKSLLAVARLQAGRGSRAGLQADSQTPGSPPPCVNKLVWKRNFKQANTIDIVSVQVWNIAGKRLTMT